MDVSVGRGVLVDVGGGRVKVGGAASSCGSDAGSGAVGSVQAVNVRTNIKTTIRIFFEFIL